MIKNLLKYDGKVYSLAASATFFNHDAAAGVTYLNYLGGSGTAQRDPMADVGGVYFAALEAQALEVGTDPIPDMLNYDDKVYNLAANGQYFSHDPASNTTYLNYFTGQVAQKDPMTDAGGAWFAALQAAAITVA